MKDNMIIQPTPFKSEEATILADTTDAGAPYPVDALGPLQAVVVAVSESVQAPVELAAGSALALAASLTQGFADVKNLSPVEGDFSPLSVFAFSVAGSGTRKSSVDSTLMRSITTWQREQSVGHKKEMLEYNRAMKIYEKDENDLTREKSFVDKSGNKASPSHKARDAALGCDFSELGEPPRKPRMRNRIINDMTPEGLRVSYTDGQPSIMLANDEAARVLDGYSMSDANRSATVAALNACWDGKDVNIIRAGAGMLSFYGRRLSISLMIQPEAGMRFLNDRVSGDIGLHGRLLVCMPANIIGTRDYNKSKHDQKPIDAWDAKVLELLNTPYQVGEDDGLIVRQLPLSDYARQIGIEFSDEAEKAQLPDGKWSHITSTASKTAEMACRLAGIMTMFDNLSATEVGMDRMGDGITLARWYCNEAARLQGRPELTAETSNAILMQDFLQKWAHPDIYLNEVIQRGPKLLRAADVALPILRKLERHKIVTANDAGTEVRGAKRSNSWQIHQQDNSGL